MNQHIRQWFVLSSIIGFLLSLPVQAATTAPKDGRLPGTSAAGLQLQKDAAMSVFVAASMALKIPKSCQQVDIPNTQLVSPPKNPVFKNGVLITGNWQERWTVAMCGKKALVPITFIPDGKGGTYYKVAQKEVTVVK
jgi:hypothetical protein